MEQFSGWEGCRLDQLMYAGDAMSVYDLESVKTLDRGEFDESILFFTAFRSPVNPPANTAWEPDTEYFWSWSLARLNKGDWSLVNWGWYEPFIESEQYTMDEMFAATDIIYAEFERMEGTRVHFVQYAGDEFSAGELDYVNSLEKGSFDECAVFNVWFQSPKDVEFTAWEADQLYNWGFYLARSGKGEWQLLTYGN